MTDGDKKQGQAYKISKYMFEVDNIALYYFSVQTAITW